MEDVPVNVGEWSFSPEIYRALCSAKTDCMRAKEEDTAELSRSARRREYTSELYAAIYTANELKYKEKFRQSVSAILSLEK